MECIRCAVCCTRYQAMVSPDEAEQIASYLSIPKSRWVDLYSDPRWPSSKNYLIRYVDGACIFLKYANKVSRCEIQPIKPICCREWIPSTENDECREGLRKMSRY